VAKGVPKFRKQLTKNPQSPMEKRGGENLLGKEREPQVNN